MTEEEAKAEAADAVIKDIDDKGNPIERPGILTDRLPDPYPNKKAAAAANNGAAPPDLSLMALARHGGDDYVFALLTGYFDPPAGIKVDDGKAYNPYFPGGVISMPQQLFDEGIEYKVMIVFLTPAAVVFLECLLFLLVPLAFKGQINE
ncbi:cytochrome c1 domain protein [Ancylostoma caninum]|uniref:Cytochrome c1 domain protein n=1 Tax=Ancylostoma caninum TaxID=29170 RepID=A0A368F9H1_ANCCA|nr:cytochrome c1 domain protein [Ancylostoma caninum]